MTGELHWDDADELGFQLTEKFPELNPLEIRFTDLHKKIIELPTFADDPGKSNEAKLEAIQMAWYEEWKERNE